MSGHEPPFRRRPEPIKIEAKIDMVATIIHTAQYAVLLRPTVLV